MTILATHGVFSKSALKILDSYGDFVKVIIVFLFYYSFPSQNVQLYLTFVIWQISYSIDNNVKFLQAVVVTNSISQTKNVESGKLKNKFHVLDVSG